jgi:predicted nucleic acid-binding protein
VSGFLLDTNLISELVRTRPDAHVVRWFSDTDESLLHLSVLMIGEIRKGVSMLPKSKRRTLIENWLSVDLRARFAGRILTVDENVANRWGDFAGRAQTNGKPLSVIDGLLAATAVQHNLSLATRNIKDFESLGVSVVNPWQSSP